MNWSDEHDYLDVIDDGYLTTTQFLNYNYCRDMFIDEFEDDELYSMANSNGDGLISK
jgi:hypothetical protein|tara:strand:- start:406 stop:576 length:171 start_codon:yes stop_codon:yes gene_type:complete